MAHCLLMLGLILAVATAMGWLAAQIGQPRVVGEIVAGILLGPTVFGADLTSSLYPEQVRFALLVLATLGLVIFMYSVGLDFDARVLRGSWGKVIVLAVAATAVPAAMAWPLAALLPAEGFMQPGADPTAYRWFVAAALSVSAFPVAAVILTEMKMMDSSIGKLGIGTAAGVTVLMFILLAYAAGLATGAPLSDLGLKLLGLALIIVFLFAVFQPGWHWLAGHSRPLFRQSGAGMVVLILLLALLAGVATSELGFTLFLGPFLLGAAALQDSELRSKLADPLRWVTRWLLLPIFFVISGLSVDLRVLTPSMLLPILLVVLLGSAGKLVGITATGRAMGLPWHESLLLGSLLNCRGLLVLVIALAGQELGLIGPGLFIALVAMALVSTIVTGPLINIAMGRAPEGGPGRNP